MDIGSVQVLLTTLLTMGSGVSGWIVGRRKRNNDFLTEQQESIELLAESNKSMMVRFTQVLQEVVQLRGENAVLQSRVKRLEQELEELRVSSQAMQATREVRQKWSEAKVAVV